MYHGLIDENWRKYLWLDVSAFAENLLKVVGPDHSLSRIAYFTTRIGQPPERVRRQSTYLDAIRTIPSIDVIEGRYEETPIQCNQCGRTWQRSEEKTTDIAIATEMLMDGMLNRCDSIILVSGDSDQCPAIEALLTNRKIDVRIAFPPKRKSKHLVSIVGKRNSFKIPEWVFAKSQLPEIVVGENDVPLGRPQTWI